MEPLHIMLIFKSGLIRITNSTQLFGGVLNVAKDFRFLDNHPLGAGRFMMDRIQRDSLIFYEVTDAA